jgi:L-glyceraldehyde 3-phosphate reductase
MLTDRYLNGIPSDSRVARDPRFLREEDITEEHIKMLSKLNELAKERGQTLAQMALAWCLRKRTVTSVLIGASKPSQVKENVLALKNTSFTQDELAKIDEILSK